VPCSLSTSSLFLAAPSSRRAFCPLLFSSLDVAQVLLHSWNGAGTAWRRRVPRARPCARHHRSGDVTRSGAGPVPVVSMVHGAGWRAGRRCALRGAAARGNKHTWSSRLRREFGLGQIYLSRALVRCKPSHKTRRSSRILACPRPIKM